MKSTRYCPNCGEECSCENRFCLHCRAELPPATGSERGQSPRPAGPPDFAATELGPVAASVPEKATPVPDFAQTELGFPANFLLLNRYRIQRQLGMGGMGRVYLATDEKLGIPVAIKVLREVLSRDPGSVKRLIAEAKLSIMLAHPNVVRIHNFEDGETVKFLVMEYVEGETLAYRIARERKLPEEEARRIAIEVCKGLEHAHQKRVIHRDIKPGNILLAKNGEIKIADFGIARECRDSVSRLTSQVDSGTLLYMSPEQLDGKSNEASDLYSLGVVLYEMLTGDPPFRSGDIPHQIREMIPDFPIGTSTPIDAIVQKCLEKKPERRFASVRELREELDGTAEKLRQRERLDAEEEKSSRVSIWQRYREWHKNRKPIPTVALPPTPAPKAPEPAPPLAPIKPIPARPVTEEKQPGFERRFILPSVELLTPAKGHLAVDESDLMERARQLAAECAEFDVHGSITQIHPGPVVTTFEFKPDAGVSNRTYSASRLPNLRWRWAS